VRPVAAQVAVFLRIRRPEHLIYASELMSRHRRRAPLLGWTVGVTLVGCGALGDPQLDHPQLDRPKVDLSQLDPPPRDGPELGDARRLEPGPSAPDARQELPLMAAPPALDQSADTRPIGLSAETIAAVAGSKLSVLWRFRSAAPVTGSPAVSSAGLVYVATVEGYVHALEPDGAFRWSYGVEGIPIGAPAVDADGRVYVATTAQRLYALRPDGRLFWMQRTPARLATPPVWVAPGFIYYVGRDQNVYDVAAWNSAPSAHYLGQAASGPLASLGDGLVAVGTAAPDAQVFRRSGLVVRLALDSGLVQPLLGGKAHWFALTRSGLFVFDVTTRALVWNGPAQRAGASADEQTLVALVDRELAWLSPHTGAELYRVRLTGDVSAPPVVTNAGMAVVPMVSGDLLVIEPRSTWLARVEVARAPAWFPVWSEPSRRVTAAAGGMIVGLDLPSSSHDSGEKPAPPAPEDPQRAVDGGPKLGAYRVRGAHRIGGADRVQPPPGARGGAG
jgi:hypothetical protein